MVTAAAPPRAGRRLRRSLIILVVLIAVLVALDFVARFVAQGKIASEIQQHGFPKKPSVTIEGFPFLTQVASHDISQIRLSSRDIPEGPVQIAQVSAVMTGIHLNSSFSSGTVDRLNGSVLVTFRELTNLVTTRMGSLGSLLGSAGLTMSAVGQHEVRASISLVIASGSATWLITRPNGHELAALLVSSSNIPSALLGSLREFTVSLPRLPLGVKIDSVRVTPDGISGTIGGRDLPFGSSS